MKKPEVSVIMSAFNHERFVKSAIHSVLSQQGVDIEFLIADDGSTDKTSLAIKSVKDPRIKFFPQKTNKGASYVTNKLISLAKAPYIAVINSDDLWNSSVKLKKQLEFLDNNKMYGACFTKAKFIDSLGNAIEKKTLPFGDVFDQHNRSRFEWFNHFFYKGNCLCHPSVLIRKKCYGLLGKYSYSLRQLPDFEMWIRLVKFYEIHIIDEELLSFRIDKGKNTSTPSKSNNSRVLMEHFLIANNLFDSIKVNYLKESFPSEIKFQKRITSSHLEIEKAFIMINDRRDELSKIYNLVGLSKLHNLLNNPQQKKILRKDYFFDERDYYRKTSTVEYFERNTPPSIYLQAKNLIRSIIY